jgi:beta-lactamase class A
MLRRVLPVATLLLAVPVLFQAQEPHLKQLAAKLQDDLQRLASAAPGIVGVSVVDISSGRRFGVNDAMVFPQGSAIKIPILIELFHRADRGDLKLGERLTVRAADQVGGSGVLQYFSGGGSEMSLHDLAVPMIVLSDNTATNMLIDRLGMDRINATMSELGAASTKVQRRMIQPQESAKGNENISTPREAADIMVRLSRCALPMKPAACAEMRRILELPKSGAFRERIPSSVAVAWKPGGIEGVETAWGLVDVPGAPYAIAVMINYGADGMSAAIRDVSSTVYRYFTQIARSTPNGARVPIEYIRKRSL